MAEKEQMSEEMTVFLTELNWFMTKLNNDIVERVTNFTEKNLETVTKSDMLMKIFTIYTGLGSFISRKLNEEDFAPFEVLYHIISDEDTEIEMYIVPEGKNDLIM